MAAKRAYGDSESDTEAEIDTPRLMVDEDTFAGPLRSVHISGRNVKMDNEQLVYVHEQVKYDQLFKVLYTVQELRQKEMSLKLGGVTASNMKMWAGIIKGCINADRPYVKLCICQMAGMHPLQLTIHLDEGLLGLVVKAILAYSEGDLIDTLLQMYCDVLATNKLERDHSRSSKQQLDEADLAARLNCAEPLIQLVQYGCRVNQKASASLTVTASSIPIMERANKHFYKDMVLEIVNRYLNIVMHASLSGSDAVKKPETVRTQMVPALIRMIRKALRKNRKFVVEKLAESICVEPDILENVCDIDSVRMTNRLLAKTDKSQGEMISVFNAITSIPKEKWAEDYTDSSATSDTEPENRKGMKLRPWFATDIAREATMAIKAQQKEREVRRKKKSERDREAREREDRTLKQNRYNKKRSDEVKQKPEKPTEEQEAEDDQLEKLQKKMQELEVVESELYDDRMQLDLERATLASERERLAEEQRRMKVRERELEQLKEKNEGDVDEEKKKARSEQLMKFQLQRERLMYESLELHREREQAEARNKQLDERAGGLVDVANSIQDRAEQLEKQKDDFEAYQIDSALKMEEWKKEQLDSGREFTVEMANKFVLLASSLAQIRDREEKEGGEDQPGPSGINTQGNIPSGGVNVGRLVDVGAVGDGRPSQGAQGEHVFDYSVMPVLEENLVEEDI